MITYKYAHKDKLDNALRKNKNNALVSDLVREKMNDYDNFLRKLIPDIDSWRISSATDTINGYMDSAKDYETTKGSIFGPRTKFYSSILEELPVHFVKSALDEKMANTPILSNFNIVVGGSECVVRIGANPDGSPFQEKKLIDFAVALRAGNILGGESYIPLLGLEVKKYVDKTMFATILETYKSLSVFRPRTYYGFLAEDESRGHDVIMNSQMYRAEFVLSGIGRPDDDSCRNPIISERLEDFIRSIRKESMSAMDSLA